MILHEGIVVHLKVVGKRRLQARVTLGDSQRVAVIGNIKQVGHLRLLGCSTVGQLQLCCVVRTITEVDRRSYVEHGTCSIRINMLVVLDELRALRLEHQTSIELVVVADLAVHHIELMDVVLIFRETAQTILVVLRSEGVRHVREIVIESTIYRLNSAGIEVRNPTVVIGRAVALVIAISELVAELQVGTIGDRLTIGNLS